MARIIKNPPPFNLTLSRVPDDYLSDMIHKGGAAMGRSPRMPPFGGDLSETDIKSVMMYVKTLRTAD
jgi:cytochrome c553